MKKIIGYILLTLSIVLFVCLVLCMILIKKNFMKYLLLIVSYTSVITFCFGMTLIRRKEDRKNEN